VDEWDHIFAVNARGAFLCYKAAAKAMIELNSKNGTTGGKIIGACSIAGKRSAAQMGSYSASKFAIRSLTHTAAAEFGRFGITVNAYCPGAVYTPLFDTIDKDFSKVLNSQIPDEAHKVRSEGFYADTVKSMAALGRLGQPEDISPVVSFLASKASDYMTGQLLTVDGGIVFD